MSASISRRQARERRSFPARIRRRPHQLGAADALFSRGHRCIAYSARGYTPSDVPPSPDAYTYKHFYTDALAVLDHLQIPKAHFVGLSMGSYSSLQIGLNAPERALSLTLAAVGSGFGPRKISMPSASNARPMASNTRTIGSAEVAKATREAPSRIPFLLKDPRGHADFYTRWRGTIPGLGQHHAQLSGRQAFDLHADRGDPKSPDADADHLRRRGRQLHRAQPVPEEAPAGVRDWRYSRSRAMCSISKSPRCSTKWSSASSRWSKPGAGRCATQGR